MRLNFTLVNSYQQACTQRTQVLYDFAHTARGFLRRAVTRPRGKKSSQLSTAPAESVPPSMRSLELIRLLYSGVGQTWFLRAVRRRLVLPDSRLIATLGIESSRCWGRPARCRH